MKNKISLIIIIGIIGLASCNKEETQLETEIAKIEETIFLLDGVSYTADVLVDTETREELELLVGKDAEKINTFFEKNSAYATHFNLDDNSVQYFSDDKKMEHFMNNDKVKSSSKTNTINARNPIRGSILLTEHPNQGGRRYLRTITPSSPINELDLNTTEIGGLNFNDIASSLAMTTNGLNQKINIRFYEHANFNGRSVGFSTKNAYELVDNLARKCRRRVLGQCLRGWEDVITSYSATIINTNSGGGGGSGGGGPIHIN